MIKVRVQKTVDTAISPLMKEYLGHTQNRIKKIAKKHKVSIESLVTQLRMGLEVEKEHSKDLEIRMDTALDHLAEMPDYYSKLKKVENNEN